MSSAETLAFLRENFLGIAIFAMLPIIWWSQGVAAQRQASMRREFSEPEQVANARAFQRRRGKAVLWGVAPILGSVGLGAWGLSQSREVGPGVLAAAFLLFAAGLAVVLLVFRCPACGALPLGGGSPRGQSLDLNPEECRRCGARLK